MNEGIKILIKNKKARHEFFIEETYEAGVALVGSEVKSIRSAKANIKDAFVRIMAGEAYIYNMHISPYEKGSTFNQDPLRIRKLLLHKKEIVKLMSLVAQKGLTLVPLSVYLKKGRVKMEIGVARGKKLYDKREDLKRRDADRQKDIARKMAR
ncbi:MAG: SsrA-binding protein SmpB [Eubacteriales bacterium]|nr:SsrA-binding protein SmpB [Eubacteriales bacterium]